MDVAGDLFHWEIGKFLDRMKREGLYEDAHFMFLTDHGGYFAVTDGGVCG